MAFDLKVFNEQTHTVITETIAQEVEKFNAASGGAIILATKPTQGDFDIRSSFKEIANLVRYRNAYGSGAAPTAKLEQLLNIAVKVAAGTPEISWEPQQYKWTLQNPELAALTIGKQLGKARIAHMLNTGIKAAVAAISGNTYMVSGAGTDAASLKALNKGSAKMGDRSMALRAWVMHSATIHNLFENALTNTENLFSYDTVNVIRDPFGRLFVVTDSPDLVDTSGANPIYRTLGLVEGGALVHDNADFYSTLQEVTGSENITAKYQAEWSYNTAVYGYAWDTAAGGKSPNAAALGTSANWDKTATSNKNTAGVLVLTK